MNETEKGTLCQAMKNKLHNKRTWFYISIPLCFVAVYALMLLIPNEFASSFSIARESEQAVEVNRAITLNQPANYDLGVTRTDNAVSNYGYTKILQSQSFLLSLLDMPVRTADRRFEGTYMTYYMQEMRHLFGQPEATDDTDSTAIAGWMSSEQAKAVAYLKSHITSEFDFEAQILTITCLSQDPLVSLMMAQHVNKRLLDVVGQYEQDKMQITLDQLTALTERAEADYHQAAATHAANAQELENAYRAFQRQQIVYEAAMLYHPAFLTLSQPSFSREKAAPHRTKTAAALTLLWALIGLAWMYRKQILRYI